MGFHRTFVTACPFLFYYHKFLRYDVSFSVIQTFHIRKGTCLTGERNGKGESNRAVNHPNAHLIVTVNNYMIGDKEEREFIL
jgi:hypothetical protein